MDSSRFNNFAAAMSLLLAACGSEYDVPGGPSGGPRPEGTPGPNALTGVLVDAAVSGVEYETASVSGVTTDGGEFLYEEGESVRFFLGDTILGEVQGQEEVSTFDLVGIEPLTTGLRGFEEHRAEISRAANIATLLQTFDYDGDPTNGIEITPEVAALFDGVEVDLDRDIFDFMRERTYRSILNRANEEVLLDGYRAPRGGIAVMEHLYAELDLSPGFFAPDLESFDTDSDGEIEQTTQHAYREKNLTTTVRTFEPLYRTTTTTWTFDDYGNQVAKGIADEDGVEYWAAPEYDADGNRLGGEYDTDGDGVADYIATSFYNEYGDYLGSERDNDADGNLDSILRLGYDDHGNLNRREHDSDGDGNADFIEALEWTADRRMVRRMSDHEGDGVFDVTLVFEHDEAGRVTQQANYQDGSDVPISIEEWRYDERGLETYYARDRYADGVPDVIEHRNYDERGHLIALEYDHDADGEIDRVELWVRDPDGNVLRYENDQDNDTVPDEIKTYEYDIHGNQTLEARDNDGDGTPERVTTKTYVPVGWDCFFYRLRNWLVE